MSFQLLDCLSDEQLAVCDTREEAETLRKNYGACVYVFEIEGENE